MTSQSRTTDPNEDTLGEYLKRVRQALNLSLRDVESQTERAITNGYLSQIEKSPSARPSPNVLYQLAEVYGIDYRDLMQRAGHHVPTAENHPIQTDDLAGIPLRALEELTPDERRELTHYIAWMRERREKLRTQDD